LAPSTGAELGNTGCVDAGKNTRFTGHCAMVQDACITPRELFAALSLSNSVSYSATEVIGRKLRALYDDASEPCPARMIQLLHALDAEKFDCALTQIPHLGTIN
jgi:hypothetical protein